MGECHGVTSTQPLNVTLKDGQRIVGMVTTEGTKFQVATKETGSVTAARESVQSIRSEPEQKAYDTEIDRYKNPRLIDLWTGTFDLGFAEATATWIPRRLRWARTRCGRPRATRSRSLHADLFHQQRLRTEHDYGEREAGRNSLTT